MDLDWLATIRQRFDAGAWQPAIESRPVLFVLNFSARRVAVPGWTCERYRTVADYRVGLPPELAPEPDYAPWTPPAVVTQAFWRNAADRALLKTDLFECASRDAAHETLVRLLGELESPLVARKTDGAGDVSFGGRGDGFLLFARGNLVCLCRNVERAIAPVMSVAAALDEQAVGAGRYARLQAEASRPPVRHKARQAGEQTEVVLAEGAAARSPDAAMRRFIAPEGDIVLMGDKVLYRGPSAVVPHVESEESA
jgi:hypothetical protein